MFIQYKKINDYTEIDFFQSGQSMRAYSVRGLIQCLRSVAQIETGYY